MKLAWARGAVTQDMNATGTELHGTTAGHSSSAAKLATRCPETILPKVHHYCSVRMSALSSPDDGSGHFQADGHAAFRLACNESLCHVRRNANLAYPWLRHDTTPLGQTCVIRSARHPPCTVHQGREKSSLRALATGHISGRYSLLLLINA